MTEYKIQDRAACVFPSQKDGAGRSQVNAAAGPYQIVQRLPAAEDGEFTTRSGAQSKTRVARESELTRNS